ncbi:histidine phosphatase family protein [Deinococcus altitudinis]|uniref:histidine phosphatase family protein n=1 Tax=Deinococcus altitudinis TaxID=468914 RepID=UPI0038913C79
MPASPLPGTPSADTSPADTLPAATLLLVRHGETPNNAAQMFRGPDGAQEPLSEKGHAEALALGAALAASGLANLDAANVRLYASPYVRAQQTARHLADALGVPLHTLPGVHEIHTGAWQGRPYSAMQTHAHELTAPDGHFGYPGGESLVGVAERFHTALLGLEPQAGETVIVVSHGAALVALLARLLGRDAREVWFSNEFHHPNTAVTELSWQGEGQPTVLRLADVSHLSG